MGVRDIRRVAVPVTVYGLGHAAVDGACAALLVGAVSTGRLPASEALAWVLVYNLAAFAAQPWLGLLVDRLSAARLAAVLGVALTALALPLSLALGLLRAAIVLAGLGNALFHVGGGSVSLRLAPGRAYAPGIFVAPGAAGLAIGTLLGKAGTTLAVPAAALLVVGIPLVLVAPTFPAEQPARKQGELSGLARIEVAALLVLLVVASRSFTGFAIQLPWKAQLPLLAALTAAVVLGKAVGGMLADRFGHARVAVGALAISAPLLVLAPQMPLAGLAGMFALNMTMPVTLVAVAEVVPGYPGFAFGLASLAIVVGAFPVLAGAKPALDGALPVALVVGGSAIVLGVALYWLEVGGPASQPQIPTVMEVAE